MWFLLIFGFPVLEIYLLFKVGAVIGLANTFFYLLASAVFGIGLIRTQGTYLIGQMQASLANGQVPTRTLLHSLLIFLSGAFFISPGYISDLVGLFLLLPGSRHLVAYLMQRKFAQKLRQGSMRFTNFGGFANGQGFSAAWTSQPPPGPAGMRDVSPLEIETQVNREVIDIIPIQGPIQGPIKKDD